MINRILYFTHQERKNLLLLCILICIIKGSGFIQLYKNPPILFSILDVDEPVTPEKVLTKKHQSEIKLNAFNPNTESRENLQAMNLPKRGINNLIKYRNKGGRIKDVKDFKRMYGFENIADSLLAKHLIFEIPKPQTLQKEFKKETQIATAIFKNVKSISRQDTQALQKSKPTFSHKSYPTINVELNAADTSALKEIRGIGSYRAKTIYTFKQALGGFHSTEQLFEVYNLPDSVIYTILNHVHVDTNLVQKLFINTATYDDLASHPYIFWQEAKMILNYRKEHGPYQSNADLYKLRGLDSLTILKLKPYVSFKN